MIRKFYTTVAALVCGLVAVYIYLIHLGASAVWEPANADVGIPDENEILILEKDEGQDTHWVVNLLTGRRDSWFRTRVSFAATSVEVPGQPTPTRPPGLDTTYSPEQRVKILQELQALDHIAQSSGDKTIIIAYCLNHQRHKFTFAAPPPLEVEKFLGSLKINMNGFGFN